MHKRNRVIILAILVLAFAISLWFYPRLPERMASHWNAQNQVDGYMSRFWGAFLLPISMVALTLLFLAIPRIDPWRENFTRFLGMYEIFIIFFLLYLLGIHLWMLLWNVGIHISPSIVIPIGLGELFIVLGFLLDKVEPNWFVGIRTPWTLSSARVWKKTHHLGARLMKALGLIIIAAGLARPYVAWFILVPTVAVFLILVIYSYVLYEQEKAKEHQTH